MRAAHSLRSLVLVFLLAAPLWAEVKLTGPFGSHMVLQCLLPVPVWGTAAPGEEVTVEFGSQRLSAKAGRDGRWRLELLPMRPSAVSRTFTVRGSASEAPVVLEDVLVGEVWVCGGQSNMERQLGPRPPQKPIVDWEKEAAAADYPLIRQFYVPQRATFVQSMAVEGEWTVCSPATVVNFSAVGYFFARDLHLARDVPIGIIHSSFGGTPAEAWTSYKGLAAFPEFNDGLTQIDGASRDLNGSRQAYLARLDAWYRANDAGSGDQPWFAPELDPAGWETMQLPALWEEAGHPGFDGVAWFRKSFDLPAGWEGRDLELRVSAIDDIDTTWVNGTKVGGGSGYRLPRIYQVPAALLKAQGNVIAVRVLDTSGNGGIWDPALPLDLVPVKGDEAPLPLAGPWLARFGEPLASGNRPPVDITRSNSAPTVLFNAMIAPLAPYAIRGVTFYQGEANAGRAAQYRRLLPALIADWRRQWGQGDFPFLFVQIAPHRAMGPEIREAQLVAWQVTTNTAMVVTTDCGDADDIHPAHKQPVGGRLALAARVLAYGEKLEYSGPVYAGLKVEEGRAVLKFTHLGGGLVAKDGPLAGFVVAGADKIFHPATAEIKGDTVVVSSPEVADPVAVRYGWDYVPSGNLFNAAGLPASPFRTDVD